jgi:hypothetical protein
MMGSPAGEGDRLVEVAGWAQKVADLVKRSAEPIGGAELFEAAHGTIAPLDSPVILFQHIVFVLICPMFYTFPEFFGDGRGIAAVAIGRDLLGLDLSDRVGRAEERLGRGQIAGFAALPCGSLR